MAVLLLYTPFHLFAHLNGLCEPLPRAAATPVAVAASSATASPQVVAIYVPDIGGAEAVPIIEISVQAGDELAVDDTLLTLESDKATMDVPAPYAGKLISVDCKVGDKLSEGDLIGKIETTLLFPST